MTSAQYLATPDAIDTLTSALAVFPNQRLVTCKSSSGFYGVLVFRITDTAWVEISLYGAVTDANPKPLARCYMLSIRKKYRVADKLGESMGGTEVENMAAMPEAICKALAESAKRMST